MDLIKKYSWDVYYYVLIFIINLKDEYVSPENRNNFMGFI